MIESTEILSKLIESSVSAFLLALILGIFLPRLIKSIDKLTELNSRQHEVISALMINFEQRLLYHEAKSLDAIDESKSDKSKEWIECRENYQKVHRQLNELQQYIKRLFAIGKKDA